MEALIAQIVLEGVRLMIRAAFNYARVAKLEGDAVHTVFCEERKRFDERDPNDLPEAA